jgi:DNA polymerase III epsilon subunit-like protein
MYLFFDTETTDIADYHAPHTSPSQPYILQLSALLTDENNGCLDQINALIKPYGWSRIAPEAAKRHGISRAACEQSGVKVDEALDRFAQLARRARCLVAHNLKFDALLLRSAYHRANIPSPIEGLATCCTMASATNVLRLPRPSGGYKWPTLDEAHRHFCGMPITGAHDALADVTACMRIFFAMKKQGLVRH